MQESIRDYCQLGIVHFMLYKDTIKGDGDHSSLLKLLENDELDVVEGTAINDASTRAQVSKALKDSGKTFIFGAQPVLLTQKLDLNHLDESKRREAVDAVVSVIPQAYELGASGFGVLSGKNVPPARKAEAMDQLTKSLREIAGELQAQGDMPLVLESFDQLDYGKNCLIGPNRDAAEIAKRVRDKYPSFGILIDLSHLPLQGETPEEAWAAVGEHVVHAHVGNCVMDQPSHPMNGDEHPPLCDPAGCNCVNEVAEYLRVLLEKGYLSKERRPILSLEVCIYNEWTRESLLRQSLDTVHEAWSSM